ncbi:S8 family serine peptidase [Chloroflexi bacterium TSY]|nr:S8 family serine peptidase [Chloroflexi bacterium TSY]
MQAGTSQTDPPQAAPAADKPNDPRFDELWGLNNTGQTGGTAGAHISALRAWDVTTGSRDIIVFVIDTGVDYTHEDLNANMWTNPKECPKGPGKCEANGKDDDNNGYVDDFYGINAITDTGDPMDDFGHGTHVAGILGAVGNNSKGVVGVSHKVRIGACKFLSASGSGTVSGAIKCFNYINDLKNKQKQNILLTNNSWGGGGFSQALEDAMKGANQPLHICAAGNGNSSRSHYPAAFDLDHILSIAATDHDDLYASFSNYGPTWVDLAAPGVAIISTVPKSGCPLCSTTGYRSVNGTSMSTPYVSGAIALVKTKYKSLTFEQIRQRLLSGVDPLSDMSKTTITNGRLNLFNLLEDDTTPPAAVSNLAVSGVLMTKINLRWTATGDDDMEGNANAYDIRYSRSPITDATWQIATRVPNAPTPGAPGTTEEFSVGGLEPDTTYYFALRVLDNVGNSSELSNGVMASTSAGTIVFEDDMESGEGDWVTGRNG